MMAKDYRVLRYRRSDNAKPTLLRSAEAGIRLYDMDVGDLRIQEWSHTDRWNVVVQLEHIPLIVQLLMALDCPTTVGNFPGLVHDDVGYRVARCGLDGPHEDQSDPLGVGGVGIGVFGGIIGDLVNARIADHRNALIRRTIKEHIAPT